MLRKLMATTVIWGITLVLLSPTIASARIEQFNQLLAAHQQNCEASVSTPDTRKSCVGL